MDKLRKGALVTLAFKLKDVGIGLKSKRGASSSAQRLAFRETRSPKKGKKGQGDGPNGKHRFA